MSQLLHHGDLRRGELVIWKPLVSVLRVCAMRPVDWVREGRVAKFCRGQALALADANLLGGREVAVAATEFNARGAVRYGGWERHEPMDADFPNLQRPPTASC